MMNPVNEMMNPEMNNDEIVTELNCQEVNTNKTDCWKNTIKPILECVWQVVKWVIVFFVLSFVLSHVGRIDESVSNYALKVIIAEVAGVAALVDLSFIAAWLIILPIRTVIVCAILLFGPRLRVS